MVSVTAPPPPAPRTAAGLVRSTGRVQAMKLVWAASPNKWRLSFWCPFKPKAVSYRHHGDLCHSFKNVPLVRAHTYVKYSKTRGGKWGHGNGYDQNKANSFSINSTQCYHPRRLRQHFRDTSRRQQRRATANSRHPGAQALAWALQVEGSRHKGTLEVDSHTPGPMHGGGP